MDIILNDNKLNLIELEDQPLNLISAIKFEKINKKLKPFFSKIKWDKMFEDLKVMGVIIIMLENKKNIYNFEYIFIILDKLISKEKKQDDKEKIQEKNLNNELYKKDIYIIIEKIIKIYILFLDSIKNEKNDNKIEFVQISSKLIYLYFKFEIKNDFLISIIDKIESELLNDIFISTLDNYEISDFNFKNLITVTIQKEKFEKLYNVILKNNKFSTKFENVLKEFVINDDIEQLLDKNNINYLLLSNLYKLNFLKSNPQSPYTKETITKLRNISNKIINIENISLKEMELLLNDKERIIFFPLLNVNEYLNKNINKIKDILKIKESHEFLILNDFEKMNFSGQKKLIDCIKIFFEKLENNVISWNIRLEKKLNKIKYLLELFQNLEKTLSQNYFFEKIKESNMDYSLYEQILIFFGDNKGEKINSDIITLFKSYLLLETEYKEKTVVNLVNSYYIFKMIEQNSDLDINNDIKKEINNEIKYLESMEINHKIILLIIQDNIKEIFNCYLKYKEKIKFENNKDNDKNKKNEININNNIFISFLSALEIKEDTIYNYKIDNIIKEIKNKKFIKIISILCKNSDALDFLFSITSKDCRNIQELAGEVHGGNNQNFLSIEELLTIEKIVESFELIKNQILDKKNNNKNEDEIIISNLNEIDEEDLEKYLNKYQQYKEFFSENLDKKKFTAEVIQKILNKSEFLILNSNINNFKAYYANEEKNNKENYKEFNYDYLIYLRDRALTRSKINDSLLEKEDEFIKNLKEEEKIIFENNKIFVEIVHQIKELIKILDKISQKGFIFYFDNNEKKIINEIKNNNKIISIFKEIENTNYILLLKINIKIEKGNESYKTKFLLNGEEYKNYSDIFEAITKIYENIEIIQKNAYLKKKYINFIHGKQFYSFFNYFLNKNLNENLNYFLNYLTTKENININNFEYQTQELNIKGDFILKFYQSFINQCDQFLDELLTTNNLSLEFIYQKNKLKEEFKEYGGIYLNSSTNLENEIIFYYKYFTNNTPIASTLLLCKNETTSEEIISFLHRAILCKYKIYFCLARTDYLSEEKKNIVLETIIELVNRFKEENKNYKINSCLVIINNSLDDQLCKTLFRLKYIKTLDIPQKEKDKIKIFEENNNKIMVVCSDHSGTGKSTYIKNKTKENEYVYFPIGGIFTKENTLKRLQILNKEKNINDQVKNLLMHIDLYDTEQKSLMNDFLYFVLFTKLYGQDNNIFYLSKKIKIYLEIPNSFTNFFDKFPILKLCPSKKLTLEPLEPLIVPENICSNIKIVSLYLKLLKEENTLPENTSKNFKADNKVDKNAIVFPFTPPDLILKDENNYDYNKIVIKAEDENKYLTPELCQKLIMDEIYKTIKKPTYYQITTFINVLANQLIQFNRNYFLSACTILDTGRFNNCSIRSLIINKFIELTRYFTKGAFTELLNEQEAVQTLMNSKYNEKEKIKKANNLLEGCKHESISFKNMDLALVLFHGGDNSNYFSIITNKNESDKTYIDLLNLKNFQSGNDIIKLIN